MFARITIKKWVWVAALMLTLVCEQVYAATISVSAAKKIALNFYKTSVDFSNSHNQLEAVLKYTQAEAYNTVTFYVFDINPVHGFVIVSADDNAVPILAYSNETNFNTGVENIGVSDWMKGKSSEIQYIVQHNLLANDRVNDLWWAYRNGVKPASIKSAVVPPLCNTKWDQKNTYSNPPPYLYNLLCPYNTSDHQRCLTGCVATAMAQIMKYWNYPAHGTGSYSYIDNQVHNFSNNYGTLSANFGSTYYEWNEMPNTLTTSSSVDVDSAVSLLMYHCAVAVGMDFGDDNQNGSGAFVLQSDAGDGQPCAEAAFKTFFSYNASNIKGVKESDYTSAAWVTLIENELNAGRPVEYQGTDHNYGGHTWVCDGYDENDNLHMNWGWSGQNDGYYSSSNLNPSSYNFSHGNKALIGIQPSNSILVNTSVANPSICSGHGTTLTAHGPANATYLWSPNAGLSCATCAVTNASPYYSTTYTVSVDSEGYTGIATATVNVDPYIDIDFNYIKDISCHGLSDGSIEIAVAGGTGNYSYHWNGGQITSSVSNLSAGNYYVTVYDDINCSASVYKTITQPAVLGINLTPTNGSCNSSGGSIAATVSGGTASYNYNWSNGATSSYVSELIADTYTITVTDYHQCTATALASVSSSASVIAIDSVINVSCFGSNNGTVLLKMISGVPPYTYSWSNDESSDAINDLSPGNYSVTVYDHNNCSTLKAISITQPQEITLTTSTDNPGSASVAVAGGTGPYSFVWSNGQTTQTISGLAQGTYTVTATDSKDCEQTASVLVNATTGIDNTAQMLAFNIYPNPTKGEIVLQLDNPTNESTLIFKNVLGQQMFTKTITETRTTINLLAFDDGVYFAELHQAEKMAVKQVVLNK